MSIITPSSFNALPCLCYMNHFIHTENMFTGMAGRDVLGNAVLGGASDYMLDITSHLSKMFGVSDEEKVCMCIHVCACIVHKFLLLYCNVAKISM